MNPVPLKMQPSGIITLPKQWRTRYPTRNFIAEETSEGLLIKPYVDVEYWEDEKGNCGLHFPSGIDAHEFANSIDRAVKTLNRLEARKSRKKLK